MVQQQNTTPCVSNFITEVRAKEPERDEIRLKCEEFFASGGRIENIKTGVTGEKFNCELYMSSAQKAKTHLEGMRFGKLVVVSRSKDRTLQQYWNCICDCGAKDVIEKQRLLDGRTTACKLCRSKVKPQKKGAMDGVQHKASRTGKDITGKKFGKLTATSITTQSQDNKRRWECVCDCGNITKVVTTKLTSGKTKSCGKCRGA